MKRLHVSINVSHLDNSIQFYSDLFGSEPTVTREDYAKWMLDDPRVNFVIEQSDESTGLTHAGIQVESDSELGEMFDRMKAAEMPYLEEGMTNCCYHKSEKSWTLDPDGLPWEAFYTHHATEARGTSEMVLPACCAAEAVETTEPGCC